MKKPKSRFSRELSSCELDEMRDGPRTSRAANGVTLAGVSTTRGKRSRTPCGPADVRVRFGPKHHIGCTNSAASLCHVPSHRQHMVSISILCSS